MLILAVLVGGAIWGWRVLFPGPEQLIRKRMARLEELASFSGDEGNIAKAVNVNALLSLFAPDVEIRFETQGFEPVRISGKQDLAEHLKLVSFRGAAFKVQFLDVAVKVSNDQTSAVVETTGRVIRQGDENFVVQELRFHFVKTDRGWLISRVESVKTLTFLERTFGTDGGLTPRELSGNIQHRALTIEHPMARIDAPFGCSVFDVGCWMFSIRAGDRGGSASAPLLPGTFAA